MANGWWNLNGAITSCVAAYQPVGAADYAASKVNLFNPGTYNATDGAAYPTWSAENGWMFNGASSQYLMTGFTPITLNSSACSVIIRISNMANSVVMYFGSNNSTGTLLAIYSFFAATGNLYFSNHAGLTLSGNSSGPHVYGIADRNVYIDGTDAGDLAGAAAQTINVEMAIGANNANGTKEKFLTGYIQAIAFYNGTLSGAQMAALTTAMNGLPVTPVDITAADFTLAQVTFDAPTLEVVAIPVDITAKDFTLNAATFDAPTLDIAPIACRTLTVEAENRILEVESEARGIKVYCKGATVYEDDITYKALTGEDFELLPVTFDEPLLNYPVYLLYDTFTTAESAPLASPRTCEPTGTLAITDTGNKLSIANGSLVATSATSARADPKVYGDNRYNAAGRLLYFKWKGASLNAVFENTNDSKITGGLFAYAGTNKIYYYDGDVYVDVGLSYAQGTEYEVVVIQKDVSAATYIKGGAYTNWTLLGVGAYQAASGAGYYSRRLSFKYDGAFDVSEVLEYDLGGIWSKTTLNSTVYNNSQDITSPYLVDGGNKDVYVRAKWVSAETHHVDVIVRRTDDDNCWIVRFDKDSNTIKIIKKEEGTEAEAASFSSGGAQEVLWVRCHGDSIIAGDIASRVSSTAAFNNTATGLGLSCSGGTIKEFVVYPLTVSGAFPPTTTGARLVNLFAVGDSKTVLATYFPALCFGIEESRGTGCYNRPQNISQGGITTAGMRAAIDAALSTRNHLPGYVLYNLGANDVNLTSGDEAQWKEDTLYIWDAIHTKFPDAKIYAAKTWVRNYLAKSNMLASWLDDCLAQRDFVYEGHDERVWLEGGDDGATMTSDGIHYSAAGNEECKNQWLTVLGFS